MACNWITNSQGDIVGAKINGTEERSKLFDDLNEEFGMDKAMELFAVSESDSFKDIFGVLPQNKKSYKTEIEDIVDFTSKVKAVQKIAEEYKQAMGIKGIPHPQIENLEKGLSEEMAKEYETVKNNPRNKQVKESYDALVEETIQQYKFIVSKGLNVVKYDGVGEPYQDSKEMLKDLRENNTLKFLPNDEAFGDGSDNYKDSIGLQPSGIKLKDGYEMTTSEIFRVVHDYFGHGILGNQFGAVGEENATLQHLDLYSDTAKPAVIFQTRGQNSWVNFSGVNKDVFPMFAEARRLKNAGKVKESENILERARKLFNFAEPKDGIFKNKYNFKKYETARRIQEQKEIERLNNGRTYESDDLSKLLPSISKNNVTTRGISRTDRQGSRQVQSHVLKDAVEVSLSNSVQKEIKKAFPQIVGFPKILEITDGNVYRDLKIKGLEGLPMASSVTVYEAEDYSNMRMFITEDGYTGITLTKEGHLGGAFSSPKSGRKVDLAQLMVIGIKEGATNAEAFDTFLPDYYSNFGFKAVSTVAFNEAIAESNGWVYNDYKKYNDGKPDVVHFIYDGGDRNTIESRLGQFDLYSSYQKEEVKKFSKDSYYNSYNYMQSEVVKRDIFEQQKPKVEFKEPSKQSVIKYVVEENKTEEKLTKEQLVDLQDFSNFDAQKLQGAFYDKNGFFIVSESKLVKSGLYNEYEASSIARDTQLQSKIKDSIERLKNTPQEELNIEEIEESRSVIGEFNSFGKLVALNPFLAEKEMTEDQKQADSFIEVDSVIRQKNTTETEITLQQTAKQTENNKVVGLLNLSLETLQNNEGATREVLNEIEDDLIEDSIDVIGLKDQPIDESLIDYLNTLNTFIEKPSTENTKLFAEKSDEYFKRDLTPKKETVVGEDGKEYVKLNTELSEEEVYNQQGLIKVDDNTYLKTAKEDLATLYENVRTYKEKYPKDKTLEEYVQEQIANYSFKDAEVAEAVVLYKMYFDAIENTEQKDIINQTSNFTGNYQYLTEEFPSDFYSKFLAEKKKNSKLFRNFYSNFEINEKGINIVNTDPISMRNIRIYADENLRQYSILSKQMPNISDDLSNDESISERDNVVNNPQTLEKFQGKIHKLNNNEVIVKNNTEQFIKIGDTIYEALENLGNLTHFAKIENEVTQYHKVGIEKPTSNLKLSDYSYLNESVSAEDFKDVKELFKRKDNIKEQAKKDGTFMLAPNGKKSNLSEANWIRVRTESFKNWSNNWKDVLKDENREPQVYYHSSKVEGIKSFNLTVSEDDFSKGGFFVTPKKGWNFGGKTEYSFFVGINEDKIFDINNEEDFTKYAYRIYDNNRSILGKIELKDFLNMMESKSTTYEIFKNAYKKEIEKESKKYKSKPIYDEIGEYLGMSTKEEEFINDITQYYDKTNELSFVLANLNDIFRRDSIYKDYLSIERAGYTLSNMGYEASYVFESGLKNVHLYNNDRLQTVREDNNLPEELMC